MIKRNDKLYFRKIVNIFSFPSVSTFMHTQNVVEHFLYLYHFITSAVEILFVVAIIGLDKIEWNYVFIYD